MNARCRRCERAAVVDSHKDAPALVCPECGNILVRGEPV
jgi:ribosomal protein S27E